MSVDRSLRLRSSLARHRNVLSRAERLEVLAETRGWDDSHSALGLPKVGHRKTKAKKKVKEAAAEEGAAAAPGAAAPAAAAAATTAKPAAKPGAKPGGKPGK